MPRKGQCRDFAGRFEEKINRNGPNGCWQWTSASTGRYGVIWKDGGNALAHRVAYAMYKGAIPEWAMVCHTCDNGHCVNPEHLFLGTAKDNSDDKLAKGRGPNQNGERNPRAKLTFDAVSRIRRLLAGGYYHKEIAVLFGVGREAISKIARGERWAA